MAATKLLYCAAGRWIALHILWQPSHLHPGAPEFLNLGFNLLGFGKYTFFTFFLKIMDLAF